MGWGDRFRQSNNLLLSICGLKCMAMADDAIVWRTQEKIFSAHALLPLMMRLRYLTKKDDQPAICLRIYAGVSGDVGSFALEAGC